MHSCTTGRYTHVPVGSASPRLPGQRWDTVTFAGRHSGGTVHWLQHAGRLRPRAPRKHRPTQRGTAAGHMSSLGSEGPDSNSLQGLGVRPEYRDCKDGKLEPPVQQLVWCDKIIATWTQQRTEETRLATRIAPLAEEDCGQFGFSCGSGSCSHQSASVQNDSGGQISRLCKEHLQVNSKTLNNAT